MNKSDITKVATAWFLEAFRGKGWLIQAIQGGDISRWSGENKSPILMLMHMLMIFVTTITTI